MMRRLQVWSLCVLIYTQRICACLCAYTISCHCCSQCREEYYYCMYISRSVMLRRLGKIYNRMLFLVRTKKCWLDIILPQYIRLRAYKSLYFIAGTRSSLSWNKCFSKFVSNLYINNAHISRNLTSGSVFSKLFFGLTIYLVGFELIHASISLNSGS